MAARHAVVTFLEDSESLNGVDPEFRKLVELFHWIPFCASFGVSCAGHFYGHFHGVEADDLHSKTFRPKPWGHLNIIVLSDVPHIKEFLTVLREKIISYTDASFKKIPHPFGPSENSRLEVWKININDNGCLGRLKMGENWYGEYLPRKGHEGVYKKSKARYEEIKQFWKALEDEVTNFCKKYGFTEGFMLEKRVEELVGVWKQELEKGAK